MAILIEGIVVVFLVLQRTYVLIMEEIMELFAGMGFEKMHHYLRYAHPLMQVHGAGAIKRKSKDEKRAAHGAKVIALSVG